ncbi:uncharacterized protein BP5553_08842 [Venustampulla echinocandica]|uniref:Uncharacterized protein n=1 Tax=Venustampulla echinocandica TaxID=2656787 RepID=A0A370TD58_9HELO|nr:uncharacterized protein BP5553_08842 [Venustampulla echinocandica]RDL32386.1 hypothetical protein BP5553_08842 [Venustampulla echinocandica]
MPFASFANHKPACAGMEVRAKTHEPDQYKIASRAIMDLKKSFPLTKSIQLDMEPWFNNPYTTIVADFEYSSQLLDTLGHDAIFQIAVSNALGEWIVPPPSINHHMSTREYFEKLTSCCKKHGGGQNTYHGLFYQGQFEKYYGSIDQMTTQGLSWNEIGDLFDSYMKKHGSLQIFLEWSQNRGDYRCLQKGLRITKKANLMPPLPNKSGSPLAYQNITNFSGQEEVSEEPTSVDYNDEDEEYYDELPDTEMQYLYEEQGSFNEDALEHMVNAGLIPSAEEDEEWQEGGLDENATS